ncbi:MAG: DNA-3-methyladenine glycosylase 2 family protein [Actinomycetota bacterium]
MAARTMELDFEPDLRQATFGDKATRLDRTGLWWATHTPDGLGTLHVGAPSGRAVRARAWGDGGGWMLDRVGGLLGSQDDPDSFRPLHGPLVEITRRQRSIRFGRTERVVEALLPAILGQKVQTTMAMRSLRGIVRKWGDPAPGPAPDGFRAFPSARQLARIGSFELHRHGVERKRADTIIRAARVAHRLEEAVSMPSGELERRLRTIRGIGPWTSAWVRWQALGDADAVPVGDFHIPNNVAWVLAGEPRADDERMLELLAPYAGHRGRVIRLIKGSGQSAPKYGPRLGLVDFSRR